MIRYILPLLVTTGLFMNLRAPANMPDDYVGPYAGCKYGWAVKVHSRYGWEKEYYCRDYGDGGCSWHR